MTEVRETVNDKIEEHLKGSAEKNSIEIEEKKPKAKMKIIGALIISIIGVGALSPIFFSGQEESDKIEEFVVPNSDNISNTDILPTDTAVAADINKKADVDKSDGIPAISAESAEQQLLDNAAPMAPSIDIIPAEQIAQNKPSPEGSPISASAEIPAPTVATGETNVAQAVPQTEPYDPTKFGIDSADLGPQPQIQQPQPPVIVSVEKSDDSKDGDTLRNYTGQITDTVYKDRSQNTIYVYGNLTTKVFLLPLGENEAINAFLSDSKGWQVSQTPGSILRISRAGDKANWSNVTDLFLVTDKHTYSLILHAVDDPKLRTDSLRYIDPKVDSAKSATK